MGQSDKLILSLYEINEIANAINDLRETADLSMTFNIKLGLIEDDLSDRAAFYQQMHQQITNKSLEKDDEDQPIPVDDEGNKLSEEQVEDMDPTEVAYKLVDPEQYNEDIFELRTYPVDVSHVSEEVTIGDFENLDLPQKKRKRLADAFIPLIRGKSKIVRVDEDDEIKSFKDAQKDLIERHIPKAEEEEDEDENEKEG